jgi:hypothetical protein
LENELGFDTDSSFLKYSETEFTGKEDPTSKVGEEPNNMANPVPNLEEDQPNPAQLQSSPLTHLGSVHLHLREVEREGKTPWW